MVYQTGDDIHSIPRVLIVNSQNIFKANATGITMRSLWRDFEPSKILEVYECKSANSVKDETIRFQSIQIPPKTKPLYYFIRKVLNKEIYFDTYDSKPAPKSDRATKQFILKKAIVAIIKALLENEPIRRDKDFLNRIDQFRPEIIYSMGSSFFVHSWVLYLSRRYKIPVVMHYMDDWRTTMFTDNSLTRWLNRKIEKQLTLIENNMKCGLTISDEMADVYNQKYGHMYVSIMNSVELKPTKKVVHECYHIVYAGGLHLNRYISLLELAKVISNIEDVKLIIYTSRVNIERYAAYFTNYNNTEFRDAVPHEEIGVVYEEADMLLHIESFLPDNIRYTRYSISTKIPEYMISGKPIVCFAPHDIAVYKYIQKNNAGICIEDAEKIIDALEELKDQNKYMQYVENAQSVAKRNHSVKKSQQKLLQVLRGDY